MRIGILGGTGPAGSALAGRLADVGHQVVIGSRDAARGAEIAAEVVNRWPQRTLAITGSVNDEAAGAEVVVVATPWDAAYATTRALRDELAGKVVICMCNALVHIGREFQPLVPPRGSVSGSIQAAAPACKVVAAFHHLPAKEVADLDAAIDSDVLVCSDHPEATELATRLVNQIPDLRALDAGRLSQATPIESFTAVLLQLNRRYRTRAALRFTGVDVERARPY